jgi:hypothetical protein
MLPVFMIPFQCVDYRLQMFRVSQEIGMGGIHENGLEIVPVKWIDQVLEVALEAKPVPLSDEEVAAAALTTVPATAKAEAVKH